jgi:predicted RNA-binding Zn ribbon-like protein
MLLPAPPEDLCLGFANTLYWRGSEPTESLKNLPDLFQWLGNSGGVPKSTIDAAVARWVDRSRPTPPFFEGAIAIRESIYRLFSAIAAGETVAEADLGRINGALAEAPSRLRLVRDGKSYGWDVEPKEPSVAGLLTPVLWSAADLLTGGEHARIRRCANEKCLWLFFDRSKSGTRRWCDMNACGNRAKSHRHYLKSKQA